MKLYKTISSIIVLLLFVGLILVGIFLTNLNKHITTILSLYLQNQGVNSQITGVDYRKNSLTIQQLVVDFPLNGKLYANNFKVVFKLKGSITNPLLMARINIDNFQLQPKDRDREREIFTSPLSADWQLSLFTGDIKTKATFNFLDTKLSNADKIADPSFDSSMLLYGTNLFKEDCKDIDLYLELGKNSFFSVSAHIKPNEIKAYGKSSNIPILMYKAIGDILPNNKIIELLAVYIRAGNITSGDFSLNLDQKALQNNILTADNLVAKFHTSGVEFAYDKDFPSLRDGEIDIIADGSTIKFLVKKAYSDSTVISDGVITCQWTGTNTTNIIVQASAAGPAKDLVSFINPEAYAKLKANGIILRNLTGIANTKINMVIPINPASKNSYNISTEIIKGNLSIFNGNLQLKEANIKGAFNGTQVNFDATAKLNNFSSELQYQQDVTSSAEPSYLLKVKTKIVASNQKYGLVKLTKGFAIVNFEYKSQKGISSIKATANLKPLELYVDKISIDKALNEEASVSLHGEITEKESNHLNFKLIGEHNLEIVGKIALPHPLTASRYKITLPIIKDHDTNISAEVELDRNKFVAIVQGELLDLKHANMSQFLEKERDNTNTTLIANLNAVKLKNNVELRDFKMHINCDKTKCISGSLYSKIGDANFKMQLRPFEDKEEWLINCSDAGAMLKGLDMYSNMKGGSLSIIIDTKRQEAKKGEKIPIVSGIFEFKDFTTADRSFITGLVSYLSFPGLQNFLTNKKDIPFSKLAGKFNYLDEILNIPQASAEGAYFDFTMFGSINTAAHTIKLRGSVVPSFYGINTAIKHIPILSQLLSAGKRKGLIFAPYSINKKY